MGVQEAFDVFVVAPEALHDDKFRMIFVEVTEERGPDVGIHQDDGVLE